jgi:6-phosphogluconolactonase
VRAGEDAVVAANAYAAVLEQVQVFDLALLGLGEDGHTASLFPGDPQVASGGALAIAVTNAPKPPMKRVSMSPDCLSRAAAVWFMVSGNSKREALAAWLAGAPLPPQLITPPGGIDVFTDIAV